MGVDLFTASQTESLESNGVCDIPECRLYRAEPLTVNTASFGGVNFPLHLLDQADFFVSLGDAQLYRDLPGGFVLRVSQAALS